MNSIKTSLEGVIEINPKVHGDHRGFFLETWSYERYKEVGINEKFVQDNHSRSSRGVLRGIHYQLKHSQGKLLRVANGEVFDVALDIRIGSPTFGKAAWTTLSSKKNNQFYIPPGFAHGFLVISDIADFEYKCTDYYYPEDEGAIRWDDPSLDIPWPNIKPILSNKDIQARFLNDIPQEELPVFCK